MIKVGIVGSGVMGRGIAQVFAMNGFNVYIKSINGQSDVAKDKILLDLEKKKNRGKISNIKYTTAVDNIYPVNCINELKNCSLVIEAISESEEDKKNIFKLLDNVCNKETIFATNTSSLSITELASATQRPDRFIGIHFFNPATVMNLVEVIKGMKTSENTYNTIRHIINSLEKITVEINEAPGFVVNRMLIPMINEAICILAEGVASAEDIDKAMRLGANHPMGPLALGDFIGLDICLNIMDVLYKETGNIKYRANSMLRRYVRDGWLGRKTGRGIYIYN